MYPGSHEFENLCSYFKPFSFFWEDWTRYKYNGLDDTDIYIMNVFIKKNFKFSLDDMVMFYFKKKVFEEITNKLKGSYPDYKEWIVNEFHSSIRRIATPHLWVTRYSDLTDDKYFHLIETFNKTDINQLPVEIELKNALKEFGFRTINEMIESYSDNNFREECTFKKILAFQFAIKKSKYNMYATF